MRFNLKQFYHFCSQLKIETKEQGLKRMDTLLGTQTYVMDEMAKGLDEDVHFFVILKGRQLGITTISLALDLYWHFVHAGLQGTLTTDTEENRDMFRSTLGMYMEGLPKEFRIPLVAHNRNQLSLKNRSRLFYQVAGLRAKGSLGRGKAITYLHGTETSSWGDEEGLASLLASLAETNPDRLYIFESTARGFNMFHDMYVTAKRARTQRAIFCGWWRNQFYSVSADDPIYKTGTSFFSTSRCTDAMKIAKKLNCDYYRYSMGANFQDTQCIKSTERLATLTVWEEPVDDGWYVIGADPAYGSSDWKDRFCIQVFRAYADGLEQVCEFATSELNTFQFAWVIAHLAGAYKNSTLNLEVNGPGQAVINEIQNLKRQAAAMGGGMGRNLMDVLAHMRNYMWRRNDNMSGVSNSIHWMTTSQTKERMMAYMKDYFERGMMAVYSTELLEEMKTIIRDGGTIEASGRNKDDRVIASALACAAYAEQVQPQLIMRRLTRDAARAKDKQEGKDSAIVQTGQRSVSNYLQRLGINQ